MFWHIIYLFRFVHVFFLLYFTFTDTRCYLSPLLHIFKEDTFDIHQHFIMSRRTTVKTKVAYPNYCCLCCLEKHGSIQQKWPGFIVKQVSGRNKQYIYQSRGLTRHILNSQECSAYYSSKRLTWLRTIHLKSSMLISGPTTHQLQHQPSSFGLVTTGNAPVVAHNSQSSSSTYRSSTSNSQSQPIHSVVPNMLQAPVNRSTIQEYFREQSSTLESLSNINNRNGTNTDNTTVHNDTNDDNEFPMHLDTTDDTPHQTIFSSTHFNDLEKKGSPSQCTLRDLDF